MSHGLEPEPASRIPEEGLRLHRVPDGVPPPAGAAPAAAEPPAPVPPAPQPLQSMERTALFVNREQSWLSFNRRVLEEALDESVPLLERLKFLAIASTNLDEFFEVRVAGIMELVDANLQGENPDGIKAADELELVRSLAHQFNDDQHRVWREQLVPALANAGIEMKAVRQLTTPQRQWVDDHFRREIYPVLTPLAVDPAHPFPVLLNKSLNLAVLMIDPRQTRKNHRMAVVQVPRVLRRLTRVPDPGGKRVYVFTADIVQTHIADLFPGLEVLQSCSFRVTRDSNIDVDDLQTTDLMSSIERELMKRRRGEPVRLEVDHGAHPEIVERFVKAFQLDADDVYYCDGPVNLGRLMELYSMIEAPELKETPLVPRKLVGWNNSDDMFADLRDGDILLHHPYDSFSTVEDFVQFSVRDPNVLAIKQTIYRAGAKSLMMEALIEAAQQRKQVTVVLELKARFDEEANIEWARRMEKAGVHVVYGIVGMKTHAKLTLVVRREDDGIKRYCHIGTGNYNPTTARLYTDIGLLTARADVGEEIAETFNMITGHTRVPPMQHLWVAPFAIRDRVIAHIFREIEHKKAGRPAGIRAKLNNLADPQVVLALYEASRAGVQVQLCVRGICILRPGVPGISDNISVKAVIDRFLEHSRVFYFENGGNQVVYLSSADWMIRNLDRRVEVAAPVLDPEMKQRVVDEVLGLSLADNVKAYQVRADGSSARPARAAGVPPVRSQTALLELSARPEPPAGPDDGKRKRRRKRRAQ